ncbi:MAG TPA: IclR family transcriptional regulator [Ramlibacter sp.]|uniref:IclR family transcriptional regulator n=1 Tax=Ramlibacter sp. TaxID=1917967 RepID=UPI002D1A02A2|nr:IclR family transcriptional regulator [Ramlibacter sp.]HVZ42877.1 IclR family transcriptional regulator [Ramlibacter sp.]
MSMKIAHRTLDCFEVFMRAARPLTLTELARELDAPMSSCFAQVKALRERGYLYSLGSRRGFYPTQKMLAIMNTVARNDPIMEMFQPVLADLRDRTRETVVLGKRADVDRIVYLALQEGPQTIRFTGEVGAQVGLNTSAIGKAILGELDDDELRENIAQLDLKKVTRASITNPRDLFNAIKEGKRRGYQTTVGENEDDVMGIAACVTVGEEPFAIALAGPVQRMSELREEHAKKLLKACRQIAAMQSKVLDGLAAG